MLCYGGVLIAGLFGVFSRPKLAAILFLGYALAYILSAPGLTGIQLTDRAQTFRELSLPFSLGAAAYVWRDRLPLGYLPIFAGAAVFALVRSTAVFDTALAIWVCYTVLCLAYLPNGAIRRYNRLGDYSYGIYIYAFPCQQAVIQLFGPMEPVSNMILSAPAILICAVLSWHFVEDPALRLVRAPRATQAV